MAYLPFRGCSAWFSSSVHPSVIKNWDHYGGTFGIDTEAEFLFSDDAFQSDTVRVYTEQRDVCVFLSGWVTEVLQQQCQVHDTPLGKYCLQPYFVIQKQPVGGDPYATPRAPPPSAERDWVNSRRDHILTEGSSTPHQCTQERPTSKEPPSVWRTPVVESGAIWEKVVSMMETTKLEDVGGLEQVAILPLPLFDFIPRMPGFLMKRK